MEVSYPEKRIQLNAIQWISENWQYVELSSDEEAKGERMDSVGLLDNVILTIEVKPSINAGMTFFKKGASGSLEAKIAATVGGLYRGESSAQISLISDNWIDSRPLDVVILASNYSARGFEELKNLLNRRCNEWLFNARIWHWNGETVKELARYSVTNEVTATVLKETKIPILIGSQKRRPPPTMEEIDKIAKSGGFQHILEAFINAANEYGFYYKTRPTGLNFTSRLDPSRSFGLFIHDVDEKAGINIGVSSEQLSILPEALGQRAPKQGFLNTNIYIGSVDSVKRLFDAFA